MTLELGGGWLFSKNTSVLAQIAYNQSAYLTQNNILFNGTFIRGLNKVSNRSLFRAPEDPTTSRQWHPPFKLDVVDSAAFPRHIGANNVPIAIESAVRGGALPGQLVADA